MASKKILVVGMGYVGNVVFDFFKDHYEVTGYDKYREGYTDKPEGHFDLAVVSVPTQPKEDGSCDTSVVEEVLRWIDADVVLLRSTVPPGTTDMLKEKTGKRIVFSPEYSGESKYWSPYTFVNNEKEIDFYIFGGDKEDCQFVIDLYVPVAGPTKKYRMTDARIAEVVKYMENTYFAWKTHFAAEMKHICDAVKVPYWEVRDLWALDPRVDPMHTAVFPGNYGFGGKCLPKDSLAMLNWSRAAGYNPEILAAIINKNIEYRKDKGDYPDGFKV